MASNLPQYMQQQASQLIGLEVLTFRVLTFSLHPGFHERGQQTQRLRPLQEEQLKNARSSAAKCVERESKH